MCRGARKFFFQCLIPRLGLIIVSTCEYSTDCEWRVQKSLELVPPPQDSDL